VFSGADALIRVVLPLLVNVELLGKRQVIRTLFVRVFSSVVAYDLKNDGIESLFTEFVPGILERASLKARTMAPLAQFTEMLTYAAPDVQCLANVAMAVLPVSDGVDSSRRGKMVGCHTLSFSELLMRLFCEKAAS
jgi:hypothetical protein